jgi:hypothetical protein
MRNAGVGEGTGEGAGEGLGVGVAVWAGMLLDAVATPSAEKSLMNDRLPTRIFFIMVICFRI